MLTVGGEANKLAANIALGRSHAGVNFRSDGRQSLILGEEAAISVPARPEGDLQRECPLEIHAV